MERGDNEEGRRLAKPSTAAVADPYRRGAAAPIPHRRYH
jgi:hypothetical protein